jgi:Tfp pilus assembly ATPase PilU
VHGLIEDGGAHGMQSFDQSILSMYGKDMISYETAMDSATNPNDLEMAIRGIASSGSKLSAAGVGAKV